MAYIDTSALVAYYCPEPLSGQVQRALLRDPSPTISPLAEVEFCSALGIKVRTDQLDTHAARKILGVFHGDCANAAYRIVHVVAADYSRACEWLSAFATPLRALDALHLAVAFANALRILIADKALADAADHLGVACRLLA